MKHKEHRLGVAEINLVNRHLALLEPINTEFLSAQSFGEELILKPTTGAKHDQPNGSSDIQWHSPQY